MSSPSSPLTARPRILICDDEPLITSSIEALLAHVGNYEIQTTNDPFQALELIHSTSPDLLILDITMPEMTGFDLIDAAKNDDIEADVIFVSGETSMDYAIEAIRKGASDYLKKPFEPDDLCTRVENVLKQRQLRLKRGISTQNTKQLENPLTDSQKAKSESKTSPLHLVKTKRPATSESKNIDRRVLPRGNEHILLVDNDEATVGMMEQVLNQLGYKVKLLCDSQEALTEFNNKPGIYDLLITNLTMPGINGFELIETMRLIRENLPVILSTGINSQVSDTMIKSLKINAQIMKPINIENLAFTLRRILQANSDRRKTPRYGVSKGTKVYSHISSKHFNLLDIAHYGLAFAHKDKDLHSSQKDLLTIINNQGKPIIKELSCKFASSFLAHENEEESSNRKGIFFDSPSVLQKKLLHKFIQHNVSNIRH